MFQKWKFVIYIINIMMFCAQLIVMDHCQEIIINRKILILVWLITPRRMTLLPELDNYYKNHTHIVESMNSDLKPTSIIVIWMLFRWLFKQYRTCNTASIFAYLFIYWFECFILCKTSLLVTVVVLFNLLWHKCICLVKLSLDI